MQRFGAWRSLLALLATGALTAGCGLLPSLGVSAHPLTQLPTPTAQQLNTTTVQVGTVTATLTLQGQMQPEQQALVYAHTGGTVQTLAVQNGQKVKQGQVLITLNPGNLAYQIHQQTLAIEAQQLAIQNLADGLQTQPPTSAAAAEKVNAQLQNDQLTLQQDQLALTVLQQQLASDTITAPISGTVNNLSVKLNQSISAYQALATIQDTAALEFAAPISAGQTTELSPGQAAVITLARHPQVKYVAQVASVEVPTAAAVAIATTNAGLGGLTKPEVIFTAPIGYTANAKDVGGVFNAVVTVATVKNAMYLPAISGLITDFQGIDSVNLDVNGHVVQRQVTLGLQGNRTVQVTGGLKPGDLVVEP